MQQVVIVGKLISIYIGTIEVESVTDEEHSIFTIELATSIVDNIRQYCNLGDTVGVKCRLKSRLGNIVLVGDKVTFLSSHDTEGR